jgi:hypothetical protein
VNDHQAVVWDNDSFLHQPVDFAVYGSPSKDMPAEVRRPLHDHLAIQAEGDVEDSPWIEALLTAMEIAENAGHDVEMIERDNTDAEDEDISGGVNGQTDLKGKVRTRSHLLKSTEAIPAPTRYSPTGNDPISIACPRKQGSKPSHSPSQLFRILVPTIKEVHRVDTTLGLTSIGIWLSIPSTLTVPQQIQIP